jgi:hypothetical protein
MRPTTLKQGDVHNSSNLVQIQGFDDERELSISTSTISFDDDHFPRNVIVNDMWSYILDDLLVNNR